MILGEGGMAVGKGKRQEARSEEEDTRFTIT